MRSLRHIWDLLMDVGPRNAQSRREDLVRSRMGLSDSAFAIAIEAQPDELPYVKMIRRALGVLCKLSPEVIQPEDRTEMLNELIEYEREYGWNEVSFMMVVEGSLGCRRIKLDVRLPRFCETRIFGITIQTGPKNVGEWVLRASKELKQANSDRSLL